VAEIVFIGGSFIDDIGGHNILEPAKMNTAIIVGPHTSNFRDMVNEFSAEKAICIVQDATELQSELLDLFQNSRRRKELINNAKNISKKHGRASITAIKTVYKYLDDRSV
jgi:3-deoxy-D-manno-octulosonic-acid transferase